MAQLLDSKDVVEFKELLLVNTIQIDRYHVPVIDPEGILHRSRVLDKNEGGAGGLSK